MYLFYFFYLSCVLRHLHHNICTYHSLLYLYHLYIQIKRTTEYAPPNGLTLCLHLMLMLMLTLCPHAHTCTLPPLLHYLFTYIALLSGCIQLGSVLFHSFSLIITTTPIHILLHYILLHACLCLHSHYTSTL